MWLKSITTLFGVIGREVGRAGVVGGVAILAVYPASDVNERGKKICLR